MIANFPFSTENISVTPLQGESANLGSGSDLDPRLSRWGTIGGLFGFLLWASMSPVGAPLHGFLHQRGPTQVVCLVAAGMIGAFLVSKWQLLGRQQRKLQQLDQNITTLLRTGDIESASQLAEQSSSLVGKRLLRLLSVWRTSQSSFQLERAADADSDLYQLALQNSYSLVRVLLWAIPILGFIGTVIGMSQAVGSFEGVLGNADNVDGLKAGLTKVTGGLGTAFDTTYLALMISVLLAIPMNGVERREEKLLNAIDGCVRDAVLVLSPMGESSGAPVTGPLDLQSSQLAALINEAFEQHLPDPSVLVLPAQRYAEQLTEAALAKLSPLTALVRDSVEGVAEARLSLQEQAQIIRSSMDGAALELNHSLQQLQPLLLELKSASTLSGVLGEELTSLKASIELRRAIEQLIAQLQRIEQLPLSRPQRRWPWR
jgi:biopolymer transport protein ExbB/TolQ